ncbi:preprotein translocase subunit YajC [Microbacterium paludicola]|uniref:Preprotein translocase subunit YajC n=1 Tax=Microbacterium paludicola TaxID=300019 RepID=A0A4Y9FSG5_9MICO|nr:preprotein translocase subunit YajC [Microbacterium paludicola]MBF0817367.1 preprotein translocase subunit YajC [Microbacterium paludicola]TFU31463.1 preprotein translocase subunit YajC [Microbacterium paludicola]
MDPNLLLLVVLAVLLIWMFFSSRRRQQKLREEQALKAEKMVPGARVMTRSGLFGTLVAYDKDDLSQPAEVEIAPGVVVELHTQSVDLAPETAVVADEAETDAEDVADDETVVETQAETDAQTDAVEPAESSASSESAFPAYELPDLDLGDDKRDQGTDKKD